MPALPFLRRLYSYALILNCQDSVHVFQDHGPSSNLQESRLGFAFLLQSLTSYMCFLVHARVIAVPSLSRYF